VGAGLAGVGDPGRLHRDALAALLYVANWRQMAGGNYFQQGQPSLLEHTWSLGIEEQFYLLWPLLVLATGLALRRWHRGRPVVLAVLAVAGAGGSAWAMAALWSGPGDTGRAYYGTDTRAQA